MRANPLAYSNLVGGGGDDRLIGDFGHDTLTGMNLATGGVGEVDRLTGGGGSDLFVLGQAGRPGYLGSQLETGKNNHFGDVIRSGEHAVISDFGTGDQLQLAGTAEDYSMGIAKIGGNNCHILLHFETPDSPKDVVAILSGYEAGEALNRAIFV